MNTSDFTPTVCPWLTADRQRELVDLLRQYGVQEFSHRGLRCLDFLVRLYRGPHHIPRSIEAYDWTLKEHRLRVLFHSRGATMSTTDFDELTRLVFLAHDLCIRVEVGASGMYGCLWLSPRDASDTAVGVWEAHPTLETALARWRKTNAPGPRTRGPLACVQVVESTDPKWPVGSYAREQNEEGSTVQLFESTLVPDPKETHFPASTAQLHYNRLSTRPGTLKVRFQVVPVPSTQELPPPSPARLGAVRVVKGGAGWVKGSWVRRADNSACEGVIEHPWERSDTPEAWSLEDAHSACEGLNGRYGSDGASFAVVVFQELG